MKNRQQFKNSAHEDLRKKYIPDWRHDNPFKVYTPKNNELEIKILAIKNKPEENLKYEVYIRYSGLADIPIELANGTIDVDYRQLHDEESKQYALTQPKTFRARLMNFLCCRREDRDAIISRRALEKYKAACGQALLEYIKTADSMLTERLKNLKPQEEKSKSDIDSYSVAEQKLEENIYYNPAHRFPLLGNQRTHDFFLQMTTPNTPNQFLSLPGTPIQTQLPLRSMPRLTLNPDEYSPFKEYIEQTLFSSHRVIHVQPANKIGHSSAPPTHR